MRGLDPRIHLLAKNTRASIFWRKMMDCRVKLGQARQ
jgi:hypothetical protein